MAKETTRKWNWDLFDSSNLKGDTSKDNKDVSASETEKLSELMDRFVPLIEQVNSLYNQYQQGTERCIPNERRAALENLMNSIQNMRKPTAGAQFRARQITAKYLAYKDRWDRMVKALESGRDPRGGKRLPMKPKKSGSK